MRPNPLDQDPIYQRYHEQVAQEDLIEALRDHSDSRDFYASIPTDKTDYRYAEGKWTVKQVIAHLIDSERFFNQTALGLAGMTWEGLKLNHWIGTNTDNRSMESFLEEFYEERDRSIKIWQAIDPKNYSMTTEIFGKKVSVLGLGFNNVGHELHHQNVLIERYL